MQNGILDDAHVEIDGVKMRVSIEALRRLPHAFISCRRIGGFFYDDGLTREWVSHVPNGGPHSDIRYIYTGDRAPKVPPATLSVMEDVEVWLDVCHQRQVNPVLQLLDDGDVLLDETEA
ncbi:MAG: hypothetical protein KH937_03510 [Actinomyces urogenitalis]|uniref:hypothetical protein n=1 Tax=Actinomyces urogenitalis TaxID=103621 RepID=UPI0002FC7C6B|nr:hypothetical protein [Actinomyces urogenitalis]MBS6071733.1 hypothetical protein [Actinomyces urogenitalis]MDU0864598.1 hypothetical protein [Actinomyces urogenitalis]MDU0875144.1 hypothetical protein [Actinomyces urogenitalis]MDU1564609.1 hypothetical protein [Actinomyces urogenitalis]MDU1640174.1 hypothetical protein [Actinomyces urogenitalis]